MIEIKLPWINSALLPNRAHGRAWQASSIAKAQARMIGRCEARSIAPVGTLDPLADHPISIIACPPRNPGPDADGILSAMKPMLDGIADALGVNDRRFNPITITRGPAVPDGSITVIVDEIAT